MRRRTYDVLGRAEGRRLQERRGIHSDLAAAFLWSARTICISPDFTEDFMRLFSDPVQPDNHLHTTRPERARARAVERQREPPEPLGLAVDAPAKTIIYGP